MPNYTSKQLVKLFDDEGRIVVQSVTIDTDEKWVNVYHAGEELSMSLENWLKLQELFFKCKLLIPNKKP